MALPDVTLALPDVTLTLLDVTLALPDVTFAQTRAMLNEGAVTRQRTMGNIRRNRETDSTNSYRFRSFIPRSVRLFNRTPVELKHPGHLDWADFKIRLIKHCMEEVLGPEVDWPNYDEMNGRVFPSDSELFARGEMIVKKKNGLFMRRSSIVMQLMKM